MQRAGTLRKNLLSTEQAHHAKYIKYRLVDAICRHFTETGEVGLVFEFERPIDGGSNLYTSL